MLQFSVRKLKNDIILPVSQGEFSGARHEEVRVLIGDTSLRNYMPMYIKPMSNISNITCGCETCISAMLLQSDLNKQWLR